MSINVLLIIDMHDLIGELFEAEVKIFTAPLTTIYASS